MTTPLKGKADHYSPGDWNSVCEECGRKFKASYLVKHWKGYWVCPEHWEPREAQDFVKSVPDNQTAPWTQPDPAPTFVQVCTPEGVTAIAGFAVAGCAIAGFRSPMFDPSVFPNNVTESSGT